MNMVPAAESATARSVNWRIFAGAITVAAFTAIVKMAGGLKVAATARYFGTSDPLDAFWIAFVLPSFVAEIAAGSLIPALIPAFIAVEQEQGERAAERLYLSVLAGSAALPAAMALTLGLAARLVLPLLGSGFSPAKLALTERLFFGLLAWLPLSGLIVTWRAVLNAHERFGLAAAAPVMTPALTILLLLTRFERWGVAALVAGTVGGVALEAAILAWGVRRLGYRILPRWGGWSDELKQALAQYLPMVAGAVILSGSALVDQAMAATLGAGSVSALTYGNKLVAVILAMSAAPLCTAMLPHLSRMVAAGDRQGMRHTLLTYSWLVIAISIPLTALLIRFSPALVTLFFQRGAFTAEAARVVAGVQSCSLVQLPLAVLLGLLLRLTASLRENRLLVRVAAVFLAVNIASDYALMRWLGVRGIALSSAVVHLVSLAYLCSLLFRRTRLAGA